jgi:hypothetical protein
MSQTKNGLGTLVNFKIVGLLLIFIGIAFFCMPIAYLLDYPIDLSAAIPLDSIFYIIADIAEIISAILFWVIGVKLLRSKR